MTATAKKTETADQKAEVMDNAAAANRKADYEAHRAEAYAGDYTSASKAAAEAYQTARENGSVEATAVAEAIATIGAAFYDPNGVPTADGETRNPLGFQQRGALGNLCNNARWLLDNVLEMKLKVEREVDEMTAQLDGSEVSLVNLEKKVSFLEDIIQTQIPACELYFATTTGAYEGVVGEKWKPYAKGREARGEQTRKAIMARLNALRG